MIRQCAPLVVLLWCASFGIIRQERYRSSVLQKEMVYNVYLPAAYAAKAAQGVKFPVVYLLHGYTNAPSGNADCWHMANPQGLNPRVDLAIDSVNLIAVAPDDGLGKSWWLDSPVLAAQKYSTYLAQDLKKRVDSTLSTYPDRGRTGICGVSMGGYGAFHNALASPAVYGILFAVIPIVRVQNHTSGLGLEEVLGSYGGSTMQNWINNDILGNAAGFQGKGTRIRFYTNAADFLRQENQQLDSAFTRLSIAHEFTVYPTGGHDLPDSTRMVAILRYFDGHFASVGSHAPGSPDSGRLPALQRRDSRSQGRPAGMTIVRCPDGRAYGPGARPRLTDRSVRVGR